MTQQNVRLRDDDFMIRVSPFIGADHFQSTCPFQRCVRKLVRDDVVIPRAGRLLREVRIACALASEDDEARAIKLANRAVYARDVRLSQVVW